MARGLRVAAAGISAGLVLAACGGGGSEDGRGDTASEEPIRIAYLDILQGPNATEGGERGIELAIAEINDAGGLLGRQLEYTGYNTDITPEGGATATNLALRDEPDVMIGYPVSSGLRASAAALNEAGVPVLHHSLAAITAAKELDSDRTFRISATEEQYAAAGVNYLIEDVGIQSLLMLHTSDASPTEGATRTAELAEKAGVEVTVRSVSPAVTDLTEAVLAARDVDAARVWGYPTTDALFIKQAAQNGVDIPVNTFSANRAVQNGLIPAELLTEDISYTSQCGVDVFDTEEAQRYREVFEAKYGPGSIEAQAPYYYDAVHIFAKAVEAAGSVDPEKVTAALADVEHDGICGSYKSDENNNMVHDVAVVNFPGGVPTLARMDEGLETSY